MGRIFWLLTMALTAVIAHISYILFAPGLAFNRTLEQFTSSHAANTFFILEPEAQRHFFPTYPETAVFGLCKYDVSTGPVTLSATMPDGYWTLTIYTQSGKEFYTLNDQQSGTGQFSVELSMAKSAYDLLTTSAGEGDNPVNNLGWTVESHEASGVAVFWVPLADPLRRKSAEAAIGQSKCQATAKT